MAKKLHKHCIGQKTGPNLPPNPDDGCYGKTCIYTPKKRTIAQKNYDLQHTEGISYEAAGANGNDWFTRVYNNWICGTT